MNRYTRGILTSAFVLCSIFAAMAQTNAVPPRITQAVDEQQLVRLTGTVHPLAQAQYDRGAAPDDMPLDRIHLVLKRSPAQEAGLQQLISDLHRAGSASYHKWLTPDQFGQQFGPSDQDIATISSWLSSHGFQVTKVQPGKQVLEFSGNVAQMRTAFHTQIHKYVVNGETHHANASDPQIPAALAPVVGGFVSLNNFRPKSHTHVQGKATYNTKTHTAQPEWTVGISPSITYPLAPADFAMQYDLNPLYSAGINGSGQTIAVIENSNINVELANLFRSLFNLPANPPQIIIDGNDPGIDGINNVDGPSFSSFEAYLDFEWSGAIAPAATIDLVISADTALESGLILAAEHAVYSNIAPVMSLSFGYCEAGLGSGNAFLSNLWEQAAAQGTTVVVSAGDSGSAGCDDFTTQYYAVDGLAVSGFASTPYNVAVGGTDFFYSNYSSSPLPTQLGAYWNTTPTQLPQASLLQVLPEQPWNDSQYGLDILSYYGLSGNTATTIAAGSGGASSCEAGTGTTITGGWATCTGGYPKPAWQTGTGVPSDSVRDLPDLSLFAADGANYSYYALCAVDGDCQPPSDGNLVQFSGAGGTSVSVQAFAGIMALVNQKYGRQGQANFVLYPLKAQFPAAFHDVLQGTNSVPCEISPTASPNCIAVGSPIVVNGVTEGQIGTGATADYNAAAGYNLATGLGTIDANVLVTDWGNIKFAATTVSLTSPTPSTSVSHGTAVTFAGTVSGDAVPTGDVAIMTDSPLPVNQAQTFLSLNNGSFNSGSTINFLPGGTYNVWANYGGDTNNASSVSQKVQITVTPEASTTAFNVLNVASPYNNTAATSNGATVPYGTQLILDAQPVPTTYYNQCIAPASPPASCSTATFTVPTGTVTFYNNGSAINTAMVNAEGDAEFNGPWATGVTYTVTAAYSGDASYNPSNTNASPFKFSIGKATPTIYLSTPSLTPPAVFTVQVENTVNSSIENTYNIGVSAPATPPTGSITLSGLPGGPFTPSLSPAVDPSTFFPEGVATITLPANTTAETYPVTISYSGDSNYNAVQAGPYSVTIQAATPLASTTSATMSGSISPTTNILVTGTVTGQSGNAAPTGSVLFAASGFVFNEVLIAPQAGTYVSSFSATLNSQTLFQGTNLITLQYLGDKNYAPSATTLSIANLLSDFSMVPVASIVPVAAGTSAMDTVNVSSVNNFNGTVTFNCSPSSGTITLTCPSPSNINLTSGSSTAVALQISASAATPDFTLAGAPISVTAGSSGTANITLTPTGGFTGSANGNNSVLLTATSGSFIHTLAIDAFVFSPVQVSCPAATLPPGVTCANALAFNLTNSGAVTGALTVNVAAPSSAPATAELLPATRTEYAGLQGGPRSRNGWWKLSAGSGLAAIVLFLVPGRRRYRSTLALWLICVLSFAMGCGGGGSSGPVGPGATTTKITAQVTKAAQGVGLNFTVDVTLVSSGALAGNGTVQLVVDGKVLTTMAAVNGVATFSNINSLPVGTNSISASYQGDASTQASQSGDVFVTVTGQTTVGISASPASSNSPVTFNLTIS